MEPLLLDKPSPFTLEATCKTSNARRMTLEDEDTSLSITAIQNLDDSVTTQDTLRMIKSPWGPTESWSSTVVEPTYYDSYSWTPSYAWSNSTTSYWPKTTTSSAIDSPASKEPRTVTLLKSFSWSVSKLLKTRTDGWTESQKSSAVSLWSLPAASESEWAVEDHHDADALRGRYPWSPNKILSEDNKWIKGHFPTSGWAVKDRYADALRIRYPWSPRSVLSGDTSKSYCPMSESSTYPSSHMTRSLQSVNSLMYHRNCQRSSRLLTRRKPKDRRTTRCANFNNQDLINSIMFTGNSERESVTQYSGLNPSEMYVNFWLKKLQNVY